MLDNRRPVQTLIIALAAQAALSGASRVQHDGDHANKWRQELNGLPP
jgi:hypothetical protein